MPSISTAISQGGCNRVDGKLDTFAHARIFLAGAVPFAGLRSGMLPQVVEMVLAQRGRLPATSRVVDYEPTDVARTVTRVILSYTDYVNRTVWRRLYRLAEDRYSLNK